MEYQLEQRKLWSALSDFSVDAEVGYKQVSGVAINCPIEKVKLALLERVAPVRLVICWRRCHLFGGTSKSSNWS